MQPDRKLDREPGFRRVEYLGGFEDGVVAVAIELFADPIEI